MTNNKTKKEVSKVKEELSIGRLREFTGFENIDDEEANEIVYSLKSLSIILFNSFEEHLKKKI